ncbi:MAG: hypothetical protein Q4G33_02175 [bacterium]|nr:hypothetical protein [bacterium]
MDFKFSIKLGNKLHKGSVHYPTAPAVTLAVKNILYRHYKTDNISLPYIGGEQISDLMDTGYMDLIGVIIDGELMDSIRIKAGEPKK